MDEIDFLKQQDVRAFIIKNEHADVQKLILNPPKAYKEHVRLVADQIISRNKLKNKLPEWVESDAILPPPISAEQASSQETATYKASILRGEVIVDLTGGSGVDAMALSKNFKSVVYVEHNPRLCRLFAYNQNILSQNQAEIHETSAESYLDQLAANATFYLDPGRRQESKKVFMLEDCEPNIIDLIPKLENKGTMALIKLSPMLDIKEGIRKLNYVKAVHVVSVKNECKELLFHLDFQSPTQDPQVICVNMKSKTHQLFDFSFEEEKKAIVEFSKPQRYLYEPNSSIMKAGAFNLAAERNGLAKISPNTHLYTAKDINDGFPGRCFEVLETDIKPENIKKIFPKGHINTITKNYPLSSAALKKKLNVKDGGEEYLLAFRDHSNTAGMFLCRRIF